MNLMLLASPKRQTADPVPCPWLLVQGRAGTPTLNKGDVKCLVEVSEKKNILSFLGFGNIKIWVLNSRHC